MEGMTAEWRARFTAAIQRVTRVELRFAANDPEVFVDDEADNFGFAKPDGTVEYQPRDLLARWLKDHGKTLVSVQSDEILNKAANFGTVEVDFRASFDPPAPVTHQFKGPVTSVRVHYLVLVMRAADG